MEVVVLALVLVGLGMYYGLFGVLERIIKMGHKEMDQLEKVHTVSIVHRSAKMDKELSGDQIVKAKSFEAKLKKWNEELDAEETA